MAGWRPTIHHLAPPRALTTAVISGCRSGVRRGLPGRGDADALAELAQQKGRSETVKRAAARIQADHVRTNQMLVVLAAQKGWHLPSTPGSEGEESRSRLEKLSGAAFDRAYLEAMMRDHETDIPAFEQEAAHGSDADLKRFAADTLPALREHLALVTERQAMAMTASR
jgi:putative membrane protein